MIVIDRKANETKYQVSFAAMLPEIRQRLQQVFRQLDPDARENAIEEAIALSLISYARLHEQGRAKVVTPSTLAWYSSRQVKSGRLAGSRMKATEPLSRYAQLGNGIRVEQRNGNWMDLAVQDKRASVPDQVATKLDVGAWFATLTQRMRRIATDLALGYSTSEAAEKYGVTAGRISQIRRRLEASWLNFNSTAC